MHYDKNASPVGWYVASYLLRFIALEDNCNEDPEQRFLAWENTVLIRASSIEEAYDKILTCARSQTCPYQGGTEGVPVQWVLEGVTMLLPVYEELEDGAEIMFREHTSTKLKNLRKRLIERDKIRQ